MLHKFDKCNYLKGCIHASVFAGIVGIFILAFIYAGLDNCNYSFRKLLLFIAIEALFIFYENSKTIIKLVIKELISSLDMDDSITKESNFIGQQKENIQK